MQLNKPHHSNKIKLLSGIISGRDSNREIRVSTSALTLFFVCFLILFDIVHLSNIWIVHSKDIERMTKLLFGKRKK